jgi:hypothetical protein
VPDSICQGFITFRLLPGIKTLLLEWKVYARNRKLVKYCKMNSQYFQSRAEVLLNNSNIEFIASSTYTATIALLGVNL